MTVKEKPLKDCFKCCVCFDVAGFMPNWVPYEPEDTDDKNNTTYPLLCKRCDKAFTAWRSRFASVMGKGAGILDIMNWVSKRARAAEHRRMAHKVDVLEYKLQIEVATTHGLIRKYGNTTTKL